MCRKLRVVITDYAEQGGLTAWIVGHHGVAGADALSVEEEAPDQVDIVVRELEDFPLLVGGEPES